MPALYARKRVCCQLPRAGTNSSARPSLPRVQAVCINAVADNVADSLEQLAAFKQEEAWFATSQASVLLLKIEFDHMDTRTAVLI